MRGFRSLFTGFDPYLVGAALILTLMGLVTMYSDQSQAFYFHRQIIWIVIALSVMMVAFIPDYRFLRTGNSAFILY